MGAALLSLLLLADPSDQEFLLQRLEALGARYRATARQQSEPAVRTRTAVVREVAHLPFDGAARTEAGKLLARIVTEDRAYRVRAEAARAIGRIGTAHALRAMYGALFGPEGRKRKFALMYAVLPEALAQLHHPDDMEWIAAQVLDPAAAGQATPVLREAGPLAHRLVVLTLEGIARAKVRALGPQVVKLARSSVVDIRVAALRGLAALELADPAIERSLESGDAMIRAAAAAYPGLTPAQLEDALKDRSPLVRASAVATAEARPPREAIPLLIAMLARDTDRRVRLDLLETLNELTGRDFGDDIDLWRAWWEAQRETFGGADQRDGTGRVYFFDVGMRTAAVVFVIDVSASMSRQDEQHIARLEYAARELGQAVQKLPPATRFRVLAFASDVRHFPSRQREPGDKTHAAEATRWLRSLKPAGATNTYGALMQALNDPMEPDTIVLLSDGNPYRCAYQGKTFSEHEQILAEVRRVNRRRRIRIHTVALLSGVYSDDDAEDAASAAEFLRRLARENGGECREVR
ncbi:MAG: VWA domain-containing protein [Planctomycetota bacterium]|jgi:HEAT repeat protein